MLSFPLLVSCDGVTEELVLFCAHCCVCVTIVCILWSVSVSPCFRLMRSINDSSVMVPEYGINVKSTVFIRSCHDL